MLKCTVLQCTMSKSCINLLINFYCLNNAFQLAVNVTSLLLFLSPAAAKSLQLCLTLCDTIDASPPGSPIPGILQVRTLEWVAISFSNAGK